MSHNAAGARARIADESSMMVITAHCIVASSALLWFDFALTFGTEVRRIWQRKFTGATAVYLCLRYSALFERTLCFFEALRWDWSDKTCGLVGHIDLGLLIVNYLSVSALTILRLYGIWGRDWRPFLVVVPLSLFTPVWRVVECPYYVPLQLGPPIGCVLVSSIPRTVLERCLSAAVATTVLSKSVLIALTWYKTFSIKRDMFWLNVHTPLTTLLLRDGSLYFLFIVFNAIVAILTSQSGSSSRARTFCAIWPYFSEVLTVIILSRFMLDLRGLYFADEGRDRSTFTGSLHAFGMSNVHFNISISMSDVVGNLGATIEERPIGAPTADSEDEDYDEMLRFSSDPFKEGLVGGGDSESLSSCP